MFQTFDSPTTPADGPPRLARLRAAIAKRGLAGFIVPRADAHQGEYVAPRDDRLAWLTGFSGSAGFAVTLADRSGVFVDGRYRLQVQAQVDTGHFTPVEWPATKVGPWLADHVGDGDRIGFDPWLQTRSDVEEIETALAGTGASLVATDNLVDAIWADRPRRPAAAASEYPAEFAGKTSAQKRSDIAEALRDQGQRAAILTLPDSIAWLLNIRGTDIARIPIVQAFAILRDDGTITLYTDPEKFAEIDRDPAISLANWHEFDAALAELNGPVRVDPGSAPYAVKLALEAAGVKIAWDRDPCILPKAQKNPTEIAGARAAHRRDGAAMVEFLTWLEREAAKGGLTEIDVVKNLEACRRATNHLRDISFDTISGAGPNGAIIHYRVTDKTNRPVGKGELLLVDSGGQYPDGTTDVTRTIAIGPPGAIERRAFTLVLKGMIAISMARWPQGLSGRSLDPLARNALWQAGMDYDHGTGHGVGAYLSVHEGPQRISAIGTEPLLQGMILSNEPGYYRPGAFGIRIENLIVVIAAPEIPGADARKWLAFETLTLVPIDRTLIDADLLTTPERVWLNAYHSEVREKLNAQISPAAKAWLGAATAPI